MIKTSRLAVSELAEKLRTAASKGTVLHLTSADVAVLMQDRIYALISELEAKEIRRTCRGETINTRDISSVRFGYGSAQTASPGASAGSKMISLDGASRVASLRLREEVALCHRRKKP